MKDLSVPRNETAELFRRFLVDIGLDVAGMTISTPERLFTDRTEGIDFGLSLPYRFDPRDALTNKPYVKFLQRLYEGVENSDLVRNKVQVVEDKLRMANLACDELVERVKELEKFKTHYEMEMTLRHGVTK